MSTDWDPATIDLDEGPASRAFLSMICAAAWMLCIPFDLCARLRSRSGGDALSEGADQCGAVEGGQAFHSSLNITGAQRDHG